MLSSSLKSTLLLIFLQHYVDPTSVLNTCFNRITKRAIDNYAPLVERQGISLTRCVDHCILASGNGINGADICRVFTYDMRSKICRLYDTDGSVVPAIVHPALHIDYFKRISTTGACSSDRLFGTSNNPNFAYLRQPRPFQPKPILKQVEKKPIQKESPQQFEKSKFEIDRTRNTVEKSAPTYVPKKEKPHDITYFKKHKTDDVVTPDQDVFSRQLQNMDFEIKPVDTNTKVLRKMVNSVRAQKKKEIPLIEEVDDDRKQEQQIQHNQEQDKCRTSNGYYVVIGNEIVEPNGAEQMKSVYKNVKQGDCAKYCSINKGPDGRSFRCTSLNYSPIDRTCTLFNILAEPHGPGSLMENDGVIYAEKFCVPAGRRICQEDEIFILHVEKSFSSAPIETSMVESITDCLQACLRDEKCKTAVFISEANRCELYREDASKGRMVDAEPGSVLIENGCANAPLRPRTRASKTRAYSNKYRGRNRTRYGAESAESDWSPCNFMIHGRRVKVRLNSQGEVEARKC